MLTSDPSYYEAAVKRLDRATVVTASGCWEFIGCHAGGYGRFSYGGRVSNAHRIAYEMMVGKIPPRLQIDHLCRNRACVNPDHLEPVTSAENTRRGKALITHCPAGHPYDDANTYLAERPTGSARHCRTCLAIRKRARYVPHPRDIVHNVRRYYKYGCRCATCCADRDRYVLELRATRAAS